jgi:hypothetical protein
MKFTNFFARAYYHIFEEILKIKLNISKDFQTKFITTIIINFIEFRLINALPTE